MRRNGVGYAVLVLLALAAILAIVGYAASLTIP